MNRRQRITSLFAAACVAMLLGAAATAGEAPAGLAALVDSMPKADGDGKHTGPPVEIAASAVQRILDGGEADIIALIDMLKEPGKGEDYKAHYLLHAVATHARRPDAEDERRMVCKALLAALQQKRPAIIHKYLLEELLWAGGEESVEPVARLLLDAELYEFATRTLVAIKAPAPIRAALPRAKGKNRVSLMQALGDLRDGGALAEILSDVANPDRDTRLAAIGALGKIGDAAAVEPLIKASKVDSLYERSQVIEALLNLAHGLTKAGETKGPERICRYLLKDSKTEMHVRCGALVALAQAVGDAAMDDVLAAMSSEDRNYRAAGFRAAITMPGAKATQGWVARMKGADAPRRVAILDLLAQRGDAAALPAILEAMQDADEKVRVAAISAAGPAGDERAVTPLTAALTGKSGSESLAARRALLRVPGQAATAAIAKAMTGADSATKVILLGILAGRDSRGQLQAILAASRSEDSKVSAAALSTVGKVARAEDLPLLCELLVGAGSSRARGAAEKALAGACERIGNGNKCVATIAPAIKGAKGDARVSLYRVLAGIGNRTAFEVVRGGLGDADDSVKDAALRGLAAWPDDTPAKDLLKVARETQSEIHHALALRAYVRMIEVRKSRPVDETLAMCQTALEIARRPDEKREVLRAVGGISSPKALKLAESYLKDKAVVAEAAVAVVQVARAISGAYRDEAKDAIKRALAASDAQIVRQQAGEALSAIEQFEDFITGWMVSPRYRGGSTRTVHPPEKPDAKDVKWKLVTAAGARPGVVDLDKLLGGGNCSAYLKAQIWAPEDTEARLEIGTDDGVKVWLNGKAIHEKDVPRSLNINEDKVNIQLKEGRNDLMLQVTQGGGGWEAACRVRSATGAKLTGLRYKAE